jgi:hypothetical protein
LLGETPVAVPAITDPLLDQPNRLGADVTQTFGRLQGLTEKGFSVAASHRAAADAKYLDGHSTSLIGECDMLSHNRSSTP